MLAKKEYEYITGRNQGRRDVLAYHIRQSFKPGEIDADTANRIGYELAMSFTKGNHAFVVCTHVDKAHIHNHIIFNSTTLDCTRKFKDFWFSSRAVRRISDLLCAQNGLSIIENPKHPGGRSYGDWLGGNKAPTWSDTIKRQIDESLPSCKTFEDFIFALKGLGYTVKENRKHISVCAPGQKRPIRLNTLKGDYTEAAIRERLAGTRIVKTSSDSGTHYRVGLLVDIQAKMREGKGAGYERWAKIHNLKSMAQTLIYLQENGLDDYTVLKEKTAAATARFNELSGRIKELETGMAANAELQKHIVNYSKTRAVYVEYRKAGYSKKFKELHETDIILHQAAKKAFNDLGLKKLPTVASLRAAYAPMLEEKKKAYTEYRQVKAEMRELLTAKTNCDRLLNITDSGHRRDTERTAHDQVTQQK